MNGSPLFTGDAGSGEREIRRWILENDLLEALIALPEQLALLLQGLDRVVKSSLRIGHRLLGFGIDHRGSVGLPEVDQSRCIEHGHQ